MNRPTRNEATDSDHRLDGYWVARLDGDVLLARRTEKSSTETAAFLRSFEGLHAAVGDTDPANLGLILDIRASIGRNDPEFEAGLQERRRRLFRSFRASAIIVGTVVGRLQVQRHIDSDGHAGRVKAFTDLDEALAWLRSTSHAAAGSCQYRRPTA